MMTFDFLEAFPNLLKHKYKSHLYIKQGKTKAKKHTKGDKSV